jgi:lipocalin/uncharacterized protein YbjT (DUF2867 family)/ligand-binding SRPBCC domain-containing protein
VPAMILLTGASGYIGSRLLRVLEEGGCAVRCLARQPERVAAGRATTEVVAGDCLDEASLAAAMNGVDQAYYLVHSMTSGPGFAALDRQAAANFGRAAARAGVRRIINLGGLGDPLDSLSPHLKSRLETGEALRDAGVPVIEFRASIVIGAGSLSFEMIRALVERLPVMICPRWVDTCTQPIAVGDVLAYLRAALDLPDGSGAVFEIGGPEAVSYGEMMREYASLRRLRRVLIRMPVLTPRLSGLWLGLVTPVQARVGRELVEGLRNPTVVRSPAARETFDIQPMSLREAVTQAIEEDAPRRYKIDTRVAVVDAPPPQAFAPIRRIGGNTGWYFGDALWRLRGWREFSVAPLGRGRRSLIRQTATFEPRGVAGRLYWYGVLPVHALIFHGLLSRIGRQAVQHAGPAHWSMFTYCSIISAPAAEVFRWHEQPEALATLTSPRLVRIEAREGGIRDGGRVTLSIGLGPARVRMAVRHHSYIAGRRFCDEQVEGPFAVWRHAHLCEPIGASQTLYQDRIEFAVSRRSALNRVAAALLRPVLTLAFAHRHRVVRASVGRERRSSTPRWATAAVVVLALVAALQPDIAPAQTPTPVRTVGFVDLDRYAGDWFEIARFPNRFQRQCLGDVRASYARRPDGRLDVVNRCRTADGPTEARGVARIVDDQTFARLKVRFAPGWLSFLPLVWGDYWVVGLAPDYSWAVVGDPGRDYLWILARSPRPDDESIAAARAVARASGYAVERLVPTSHQGPADQDAAGR